jgi:hypothetical protein
LHTLSPTPRLQSDCIQRGKSITFTVDGLTVGSGVTNRKGVASVSYTISATAALGAHPITAAFAGDTTDKAANGAGILTVTR